MKIGGVHNERELQVLWQQRRKGVKYETGSPVDSNSDPF
jgi:hypothetical protein